MWECKKEEETVARSESKTTSRQLSILKRPFHEDTCTELTRLWRRREPGRICRGSDSGFSSCRPSLSRTIFRPCRLSDTVLYRVVRNMTRYPSCRSIMLYVATRFRLDGSMIRFTFST